MARIFLILAVVLLIAIAVEPALAKPRNFRAMQLMALKEMHETVLGTQKADDLMIKDIDLVANGMERLLHYRARTEAEALNLPDKEAQSIERQLSKGLAPNPYPRNPYIEDERESKPADSTTDGDSNTTSPFKTSIGDDKQKSQVKELAPRVHLQYSSEICYRSAQSLRKEAPQDWHGAPGSINIIHNGYDTCLIWGAGYEGKPVFDRIKQRFKVVSIRVSQR